MKKVLSVLLAAAMVMGMSVSAMAAEFSKPVSSTGKERCENDFTWGEAILVDAEGKFVERAEQGNEDRGDIVEFENIVEGDAIYFEIYELGKKVVITEEGAEKFGGEAGTEVTATTGSGWVIHESLIDEDGDLLPIGTVSEDGNLEIVEDGSARQFGSKLPANWILKVKNSEYIKDAELVRVSEKVAVKAGLETNKVYAKVILNDNFKAQDEEEAGNLLKFFMYIWDGKHASEYAEVHYSFKEYNEITVTKEMAKHVIPVEENTYYKLDKKLNSLEVVFSLDKDVYVTAKMWKGEKYMVKSDVDAEWSKELSKEYDEDIEVLTIESNLDIREVLWESAKDNKQVVEVVDGALVAVESEFVTKYEVIEDYVLAKGYIAETKAGSYALIDATIELIVPEVEAEPEVEADKANPETGAADFVGAAVAMAVVSVAAAGALALKK